MHSCLHGYNTYAGVQVVAIRGSGIITRHSQQPLPTVQCTRSGDVTRVRLLRAEGQEMSWTLLEKDMYRLVVTS